MPERRWLKWLRGGGDPPPSNPGTEATRSAREAVLEVEAAICDLVLHGPGVAPADRLATASGAALAGQRCAVMTTTADLPALGDGLTDAVRRLVPLVVQATRPSDRPWCAGPATVVGSGAFVAAARTAQHAADLTLAARLLAEWSLRPGVVLSEDDGQEDLFLPTPGSLRKLLGWPDELVPTETPAWRALFGEERRRTARWFDPDHPVAAGGSRTPEEAERASVGAGLFFDPPVADLANAALTAVSTWTGRELSAVEPSGLDGADVVLVAWGRTAEVARSVAAQTPRVGVLGITLLRPFPVDEVAKALGSKRRAIVVIEPDEDPLAALPPLAREIASATPALAERIHGATTRGRTPRADRIQTLLSALPGGLPRKFSLDAPGLPAPTGFPRRDALLQPLQGSWPAPAFAAPAMSIAPPPGAGDPTVPALLRRIGSERQAPDSLPRFWGAVVQPSLAGRAGSPDPISSAGLVPAVGTVLHLGASAGGLPVLDAGACTGCGDCWPACPESAIGVAALAIEPLLTAASRLAGTSGRSADALRRSHKHLATKLAGTLPLGSVGREPIDAAWKWLAPQLGLGEEELAEHATALDATASALEELAPAATDAFFRDAEQGGAAELLVQAVDGSACTGCGLCVTACAEDALTLVDREDDVVVAAARRWSAWESLPDTTGQTIERVGGDIGRASATLLSRHASQAQVGGSPENPGSGGRLALRLVVAAAEQQGQRAAARRATDLAELGGALRLRIVGLLTNSLSDAEPAVLADALAPVRGATPSLSKLADRLTELDVATPLDRGALLDCARTGAELASERSRLVSGSDGLGRARFGFVATDAGELGRMLAWPKHPWFAPGVVESPDRIAAVSEGIATAMLRDYLDRIRLARRARLLAKPPTDLPTRLDALATLRWEALTSQEQADCPPLLVLVDGAPPSGLNALLGAELPIKVVVLDPPRPRPSTPPTDVFAVSTSVGAPDHLFEGVSAALAWTGPAWIRIDAPEPARDGFETDATLSVAAAAIEAGDRLLEILDPVATNGAPADAAPDLEALRGEVRDELAAEHQASLQQEVAQARELADQDGLARLTERLMGLAGYGAVKG